MVIQKKAAGHAELSTIARMTVTTKMATSIMSDHTIRVVRFPLFNIIYQINNYNTVDWLVCRPSTSLQRLEACPDMYNLPDPITVSVSSTRIMIAYVDG
jgi:hypothetical protein